MTAVLDHLERQVRSAERLLQISLSQTAAIRGQDVEALLASLAQLETELGTRQRLELERERLLAEASGASGTAPADVDLETLLVGAPAADAARARDLSARLRGLLAELGRTHAQNRVLMRQELRFVDHLLRLIHGGPRGGYSHAGAAAPAPSPTLVDARG